MKRAGSGLTPAHRPGGKARMSQILKCGLWLPVAVAIVSCGVPRTYYYTIEMPRVTKERAVPVDRRIVVQRFSADQVLVDDRILYRGRPNEVSFYEYKRWANSPVDIVTNYFVHRLKESGDYSSVSSRKGGGPSDLTLRGRLFHFEEVDQGKEVFASVALELELTDNKTQASIWRGEAECTRPVTTRDMSGIVAGISECLDETASKLLGSMRQEIGKGN
jgi:ABC-type uncharacterized transport system auxiliary subunit